MNTQPKVNQLAKLALILLAIPLVGSLILGAIGTVVVSGTVLMIGLYSFLIVSILATILGSVALIRQKRSPSKFKAKWMAGWALGLGIVGTAMAAFLVYLFTLV